MKKIFIPLVLVCSMIYTSCTKTVITGAPQVNKLELSYPATQYYNNATSGLTYFNNGVFSLTNNPVDTFRVQAIIQTPVSQDITVSVIADDAALTTYNASSSTKYASFPAGSYQIATPSVTIPAGQTSAVIKIAMHSSMFDIAKTGYMLPVSISSDPGIGVVQNLKTVYFHIDKDPTPPYDRTNWTATADCEAPEEQQWSPAPQGMAIAVLDGDPGTYWHSSWDVPSSYHPGLTAPPGFPHWVAIDMLTPHVIHGIYFLERQNSSDDKVKGVTIATSNDGVTWTDVAQITLANSTDWQKMPITPTSGARYVRTTFTSNFSGKPWTNMAEIKPY